MIEMAENKGVIYEFGKFVLDPQERVLFSEGMPIHLTDKVFETLLLLIQHNGRLLTKDEMMASIWDESFVEESNLAKNISRLRKILNNGGGQLIETLPRRGYRFLADVNEVSGETNLLVHRRLRVKITQTVEEPMLPAAPELLLTDGRRSRRNARLTMLALFSGAVAAIIVGFFFWNRGNVPPTVTPENGAIRLTDSPNDDNDPRWTKDGRIRFFRTGTDKLTVSVIMNADGTNQTEIKDFTNFQFGLWSPDEKKVVFFKGGDRTTLYLANADGSNEVLLPFPPANFDWSSDSQRLVYQKNVAVGDADIFVYSITTGQSKNVTNNLAFDADPSFSPDGKQIAFASLRDGNAEIYLMNTDGSDVRRLTNHAAWDSHPTFSPDGTTITFPSDRDNESSDIYLMNADGSNVRRLTDWKENESVGPGSWSPDGTKITFVSDLEGNDDIYVISAEVYHPNLILTEDESNLASPSLAPHGKLIVYQADTAGKTGELRIFDTETRQSRVLLETATPNLAPVFSPNGDWIVFQNRIEGNTEICLIKPDGSGYMNLTNNAATDSDPAWSPDGTQIAFASNRGGNSGKYDLYLMNSDGNAQRRMYSSNLGMSTSPAWSPDGREIVFANDKEDGQTGNFEIFKVGLGAGETEKRLTFHPRADSQPAVSPDGNHIAFISNADGNSEIYVMNSDGTLPLRITRNAAEDLMPHWSANGKRMIFASNRAGKFAIYEIDF